MFTAISNGASRFRRILDRFKSAAWHSNEMQRLDSQENALIAHELNLSVAELTTLALTSSRSVELLDKRLAHAGLSAGELAASHADVVRDLRRVCCQCPSKARCARDLARERRATPSKYCPNEQTLRALSFEASRTPAAKVLVFLIGRD
jgi:hypothetical protein